MHWEVIEVSSALVQSPSALYPYGMPLSLTDTLALDMKSEFHFGSLQYQLWRHITNSTKWAKKSLLKINRWMFKTV